MMDCEQFQSYLPDYLDGEMPPGIAKDMDVHSAVCILCAGKASALRNVSLLLKNLSRARTSNSFEYNLKNRIYNELYGAGRSALRYRKLITVRNLAGIGIAAAIVATGSYIQEKEASTDGRAMPSSSVEQTNPFNNPLQTPHNRSFGNQASLGAKLNNEARADGQKDSAAVEYGAEKGKLVETVKYSGQ